MKSTQRRQVLTIASIRYAAMVSTMTLDRVVDAYSRFLGGGCDPDQARKSVLDFLEWEEPDEELFGQDVRIILMAANFSKELTTAVMWLNERDSDIRCIRVIPYQDQGRTLIDVQQANSFT